MAVYSLGAPVSTHGATGSVTGTWGTGQLRAAGHLLVAAVSCAASTSVTATGCSTTGWVNLLEVPNSATAHVRVAIWAKSAGGGDTAPTFTSTENGTAGGMDVMLFELSGANLTTPVDTSGTYASGSSTGTLTAMTATVGQTLAASGEFALAIFAQERAAGAWTWTDAGTGAYFEKVLNGNGQSTVLQTYIGTSNPPGAVAPNDAGAFSTNTTAYGAGLVVAFALAPPTPAGNMAFANNASGTVTSGGTTAPAAGISESWTVDVNGAFPLASASAAPPAWFTVADPAAPTEKMLVTAAPGGTGSGQSWTVTRGAEGTAPVSHTTGFTVVNVASGGWLTGVAKELSAVAYVNCDYTGATDASAAFNAALATLPVINGYPVGTVKFGPGLVRMAVTPDNPGSCVYVEGAGRYATYIYSYVTGGDCFRVFDPGVYARDTNSGGGISGLTIMGTNAGAGAVGLHAGDLENYHVDIVVLDFTGANSKGVWFDNENSWCEQMTGDLKVSGCTQCVVFDNPATAASTSGSSFARLDMIIRLGQGLDGTGQCYGDGVVLQNGALIIDSDLRIYGNFVMSAAATSAVVLRITGTTPAGHSSAGRAAGIISSRLHVGVECDASGANAYAPMTVYSDGNGVITQCYGQLHFGSGNAAFVPANYTPNKCLFQVSGDVNLGARFQVFDAEQFQVLTAAHTLTANTSAQAIFDGTAAGTLTVPAATTYFFECEFDLSSLSSSAHTVSFGFGGTASYTSCKYWAHRIDTSTALTTAATWTVQVVATAAATALTGSVTTTRFGARISGVLRVNAAGTVIPQVTQGTAGAAAVVAANSWIRLTPVGSNTAASAGNWS